MRSRKGLRRVRRSRIYLNRIARELWPDARKTGVCYWDRSTQPIGDVLTWANSFESRRLDGGIVAQTRIGPQWVVSTVWLGLDHSFWANTPPLIFETMAFTDYRGGGEALRYGGDGMAVALDVRARGEDHAPADLPPCACGVESAERAGARRMAQANAGVLRAVADERSARRGCDAARFEECKRKRRGVSMTSECAGSLGTLIGISVALLTIGYCIGSVRQLFRYRMKLADTMQVTTEYRTGLAQLHASRAITRKLALELSSGGFDAERVQAIALELCRVNHVEVSEVSEVKQR